jgi:hypothetical protein
MVFAGSNHCIHYSTHTRVWFLSTTTAKTVITTLQGSAALKHSSERWLDVFTLHGHWTQIFSPFAILGLLRLCAATWLTKDFAYSPRYRAPMRYPINNFKSAMDDNDVLLAELNESIDPFLMIPSEMKGQYNSPKSSWPSRTFRVLYVLCVCGAWGISFALFMQMAKAGEATVATFLTGCFVYSSCPFPPLSTQYISILIRLLRRSSLVCWRYGIGAIRFCCLDSC